jgi:hypothetical protein
MAGKRDLPVSEIRRYLEPGPVVLVSSACDGARRSGRLRRQKASRTIAVDHRVEE